MLFHLLLYVFSIFCYDTNLANKGHVLECKCGNIGGRMRQLLVFWVQEGGGCAI